MNILKKFWIGSPKDYFLQLKKFVGIYPRIPVIQGKDILIRFFDLRYQDASNHFQELLNEKILLNHLFSETLRVRGSYLYLDDCHYLLYALIRIIKPSVIIETGVFDGLLSSIILSALKKNNHGFLHSIDLPANSTLLEHWKDDLPPDWKTLSDPWRQLPPGKQSGWMIPTELRDRHEIIIGDSKVMLEKICNKHKPISLFIHDSLHTYRHMTFEFEKAIEFMNKGSFLCSDDIFWNMAFQDMLRKHKLTGLSNGEWGIARL